MVDARGRAQARIDELAQARPDAAQLARYASLAARIDAPLLRAVRLGLQPGTTAAAEADLWFSDLSESRDGDSLVLDPDVAALLRERLAAETLPDGRRALDAAHSLLQAQHAAWPASLQLEEALVVRALRDGAGAAAAIEEALRPALAAMASGDQRGLEMSRWVLRAMPRLPEVVRATDAATALVLAAIARIGALPDALAGLPARPLPPELAWLLPRRAALPRVALACETGDRVLVLREPASDAPPDALVSLAQTRPLVVELRVAGPSGAEPAAESHRLALVEPGVPIPLPDGWLSVELRSLAGDAWRIERAPVAETPESAAAPSPRRPRCLVLQPLGRKTDWKTGRTLDMDTVYAVIRAAVEEAGLEPHRIDEVFLAPAHVPQMLTELRAADLVVADLSTGDAAVLVLLGIRLALRPSGTLLIAEDGSPSPLNLQGLKVLTYRHLGDDLSRDEARRLQSALTEALVDQQKRVPIDSPVHALLPNLADAPQQQFAQSRDALASNVDREQPWCLVVQGFGQKTDWATGRVLDLDASYRVIRDAVQAAGLRCLREDELVHSGLIDTIQMHSLLSADLVIADLSTANANALLELGIRWGLRPAATLVVAERDFRSPFDAPDVEIIRFQHLGKGIDGREAERFGRVLGERLRARLASPDADSPVYRPLDRTLWPAFAALAPRPRQPAPPAPLRTLRVFLASSSDVARDREEFELLLQRRWRQASIKLEVARWENLLDATAQTQLQEGFNRAIQECDFFVLLIFRRFGRYTAEEFDRAFGRFKATGRPLIWTYFKNAPVEPAALDTDDVRHLQDFKDRLASLGHFSSTYGTPDDLVRHFSDQVQKLASTGMPASPGVPP